MQQLFQPIRSASLQLSRKTGSIGLHRGLDDCRLECFRACRRQSTSTRSEVSAPHPNQSLPRSSSSHSPPSSSSWFTLVAALCLGGLGVEVYHRMSLDDSSKEIQRKNITKPTGRPDLNNYLNCLRKAGFQEDQISIEDTDLEDHGHSPWSYHPSRKPSAVVYPTTIEQVQSIVKNAPNNGIVLLPFAGGTSLEAHWSAPSDRPGIERIAVSVDVNLMDKIGKCNIEDGDIEVEAGVKYEDLNEHLKQQNIPLFFPVDPGPGAALGGMMGTGGSGTNAVRYGTMKGEYILNATIVLPNGEIIITKKRVRKSSVGPDLTKLFLGAEGTFGIIVKVTLRLAPILPTSILVVPFPNIGNACSAAQKIVNSGIGIQCIELLDDEMIKVINKANEKTHGKGNYKQRVEKSSLFIKLQGSEMHRKEDEKSIRELTTSNSYGAKDKEIESSHDSETNEELWRARKIALWSCQEAAPERKEGGGWKVWTTDVSVPLGSMATLFEKVRKDTIKTGLNAPIVGHIGDGGAHSIIVFKDDSEEEMQKVKAFVHRIVGYAHELDGTCTSEHGVGRGKRMYLQEELGASIELLKTIKESIDPHHIMNPGALLYEDKEEEENERKEMEKYH